MTFILKHLAKLILTLAGWKIVGKYPYEIKKAITTAAPHTSMWDFILGRLGFFVFGVKVKFLIKKELFFFPLGYLTRAFGGIPVDRTKKNNMVEYIAGLFEKNDSLVIVLAPEATRRYNDHWKKGFYYIALRARVPIIMSFLDYRIKEGGIGPTLYPTGDYKADLQVMEDFYCTKTAKFPENYNLTNKQPSGTPPIPKES